jgi:hypothetical protein
MSEQLYELIPASCETPGEISGVGVTFVGHLPVTTVGDPPRIYRLCVYSVADPDDADTVRSLRIRV